MFETTPADVELKENGDIFIQWKTLKSNDPVTIYTGPTADNIDFDHPLMTTDKSQAVIMEGYLRQGLGITKEMCLVFS